MLPTKMLLGVALLVLAVGYTEGIVCPPDYCDSVKCKEPQGCTGGLAPGFCGCCQICARVEGESCGGGPGLFSGSCDTGLQCTEGFPFGKCEPETKE